MDFCDCGAVLAFSLDGVHAVTCSEVRQLRDKEALQYWIEHAIQPAQKADEHHSSYGLKHEYERETKLFVSHAQFKGEARYQFLRNLKKMAKDGWHVHTVTDEGVGRGQAHTGRYKVVFEK